MKYPIVAALWEDHTSFRSAPLPTTLDDLIKPSLTVGILIKEDERYVIIASHIERYEYEDTGDYTAILKSSLLGELQVYGKIEIDNLK